MIKIETLINGPLETNSYLVISGEECLVIDPATRDVLDLVEELGLSVLAILNTHGHFDHISGNRLFSAPIYIHPYDAEMLLDPELNLSTMFGMEVTSPPMASPLEEGKVKIGPIELRVLHTPAHTKGSVCLLIGDALFSGDTLFRGSVGRTDLPGSDYESLQASLVRLLELPDEVRVYPGHGESTTIGEERRTNPFLCEI